MSGSENPISEPRQPASLTANLLARRGTARPAMRRPSLGGLPTAMPYSDDLGWNDMGDGHEPHDRYHEAVADSEQDSLPVTGAVSISSGRAKLQDEPAPVSPAKEQLQALAEQISVRSAAAIKPARSRAASLADIGRKAAFTLRLDPERHLRLRLLSAVTNRSAQQLLVEALDEMIAKNVKVTELAAQVELQSPDA